MPAEYTTRELLNALPSADRKDCESVVDAVRQAGKWKPAAKAPARMARAALQKTELMVGKRLKLLQRSPSLSCAEGCAYCCHGTKVDVSVPEAVLLAEHLRETLSPEALLALRERVANEADRIRGMSLEERAVDRAACVLLEPTTQACSVHAVRPLACRRHHSLDVEACKAAFHDPRGEHFAPMEPEMLRSFELGSFGLEHALTEKRTDSEAYELTQALLIALSDQASGERWLKGEPAFAPARMAHDDQDREWVEAHRG